MEINDFLEMVNYRNIGTDYYLWECYGPNARFMDSNNEETGSSVSCVFDSRTKKVYQIEAWDCVNNREYRWIDPEFVAEFTAECKARGISTKASIDDRKYIDLDLISDMQEKSVAILAGEDYDTRVLVSLDLDKETELSLMRQAHANDMTVNDYVAHILQQIIEQQGSKDASQ